MTRKGMHIIGSMIVLSLFIVFLSGCNDGNNATTASPIINPDDPSEPQPEPEPQPNSDDPIANAEVMIVGGWTTYKASGDPDPAIWANFFFCPAGGMKGIETWTQGDQDSIDALAVGTWSVTENTLEGMEDYPAIILDYETTIGIGGITDTGPGILGQTNGRMAYDVENDEIVYYYNETWFTAQRLMDGAPKDIDDSYCGTSSAVDGDQCGTDADCGRCWYCEKSGSGNICRYGGEGPYGCYRGWEPSQ